MSDNDIEIIEHTTNSRLSGNDDICQLCSASLRGKSVDERQAHYNEHDTGPSTRQSTKRARLKCDTASTSSMRCRKSPRPEDVFWHPSQALKAPENYTPGVLPILKTALKKSHMKGTTQRAVLCYEHTPHILRESFDMNWGCGYRNFMMTCAALMDQQVQGYFLHLDDPIPPSVRNLQLWLEDAWKNGYDDNGASHYKRHLVGTKQKIGTGEIYVAFTSRKIPCALVDFNIKKSEKGFNALVDWVVSYFDEKPEGDVNQILRTASPVVATDKMPIILQYEGHSVTIVGYELGKNGKYNLLMFDPSSQCSKRLRRAVLDTSAKIDWASSASLSLGKFRHRGGSNSPPKKRTRADPDSDDDAVNADTDDDDDNGEHQAPGLVTLNPDKVIGGFRFKKPRLRNKHDFQILYFTMGDLLSDEEQNNRKVVLSDAEY